MIAISVQSGSNGNCIYVEAAGARLLFDAGISGLQAQRRLAALGRDVQRADGVFISHDHSDHIRCAGVYHRKFGIPVHVTDETLRAARRWQALGEISHVRHFESGQSVAVGRAVVHTVPTPHDGADGVAFVVEAEGKRLGILTDLGHVFAGLPELLGTLDAVFIESNYDPRMLAEGPYPYHLQQRIRGDGGHLANHEAAELLRLCHGRLKWACLAHLSEQNNTPALAMQTSRAMLPRDFPLIVASRYEAGEVLEV
jgi:phosphoribosyl 1,2-cyclic phosphodiesterase